MICDLSHIQTFSLVIQRIRLINAWFRGWFLVKCILSIALIPTSDMCTDLSTHIHCSYQILANAPCNPMHWQVGNKTHILVILKMHYVFGAPNIEKVPRKVLCSRYKGKIKKRSRSIFIAEQVFKKNFMIILHIVEVTLILVARFLGCTNCISCEMRTEHSVTFGWRSDPWFFLTWCLEGWGLTFHTAYSE